MSKPEEPRIALLQTTSQAALLEAIASLVNKTWIDVRIIAAVKPMIWSLSFNIDVKLPPRLLKQFTPPKPARQKW